MVASIKIIFYRRVLKYVFDTDLEGPVAVLFTWCCAAPVGSVLISQLRHTEEEALGRQIEAEIVQRVSEEEDMVAIGAEGSEVELVKHICSVSACRRTDLLQTIRRVLLKILFIVVI